MTYEPPTNEQAREILAAVSQTRAEHYHDWIGVGMALHAASEAFLNLWDDWSRLSPKYNPGECEKHWRTFSADGKRGLTFGSLVEWARRDSGNPDLGKGWGGAPRHERPTPKASGEYPSEELRAQLQASMDGKRFNVPTPWPMLDRMASALEPGKVTTFCAPQGASKSFAVLQLATHLLSNSLPVSVLMLEDDRPFHLRRALAQLEGNGELTRDGWVKEHPDETKLAWERHAKVLDALGRAIHEAPDEIGVDVLLDWIYVQSRCNRVLVIDPITAKDPSPKPWIDDHHFLMRAKGVIKGRDCSLILTTHPPKRPGIQRSKNAPWGDDVAGGAAFMRFSHTVMYLEYMREAEELSVKDRHGFAAPARVNRKLQLRKTRNGYGQGLELAFYFDPKTLRLIECGVII
ncbi:MAG: PriCT-2 domain-containing protein [Planctomycetes bacterium]|nr:PriCT-2 domain-containing protein [Planctomycetota bacterium]